MFVAAMSKDRVHVDVSAACYSHSHLFGVEPSATYFLSPKWRDHVIKRTTTTSSGWWTMSIEKEKKLYI